MSDQFYKFIAKQLIRYFQKPGNIHRGERYILLLDSEKMVSSVFNALSERAEQEEICSKYSIGDSHPYQTIALDFGQTKVVVIPKIKSSITDDYLATLRNKSLGDQNYPMLILAQNSIDTITSGALNLAAPGEPFDHKSIQQYLQDEIEAKKGNRLEYEVLKSTLESEQQDRYIDQTAISEYQPLLSVVSKGKLEDSDYRELGLFPIKQPLDDNKIKKAVEEDRKLFQTIQTDVQNDNLDHLEKQFKKSFEKKIKDNLDSGNVWDYGIDYETVRDSLINPNTKKDFQFDFNSIEVSGITSEGIEITFEDGSNQFDSTDRGSYYLFMDGKNKGNLFVFNPENYRTIVVSIGTNKKMVNPKLIKESTQVDPTYESKKIRWEITPGECSFYKITSNGQGKKSEFSICVLGISSKTLIVPGQIYGLKVQSRKSRITTVINSTEFYFNNSADNSKRLELRDIHSDSKEDEEIRLSYNQPLTISYSEDYLVDSKNDFSIALGSILIPFEVSANKQRKIELNGIDILRMKLDKRKSFIVRDKAISLSLQPYQIKKDSEFSVLLGYEKEFLDQKFLAARVTENGLSEVKNFNVPDIVKEKFDLMVNAIKQRDTLPSFCYYDGPLRSIISDYVNTVFSELNLLKTNQQLSLSDNHLLLLGAVIDEDNKRILFSPLSPLNLRYQLDLQEYKLGEINDDLVKLLNPLNLVPYIYSSFNNEERKPFSAVEQDHSPEWRIYSSLAEYETLESRTFIKKIVKSKIEQFQEHFPFLFDLVGNNRMIINILDMDNCKEVFDGIAEYYASLVSKKNKSFDQFLHFRINVYKKDYGQETAFNLLFDNDRLTRHLEQERIGEKKDLAELTRAISSGIELYEYKETNNPVSEYCHLMFYEMKAQNSDAFGTHKIDSMLTGISLHGLVSGVSSSIKQDGDWYTSGFGTKFADPSSDLIKAASRYNSAFSVAYSGSDFNESSCTNIQINANQNQRLKAIYDASYWVIFINPKVDLNFFVKNNPNERVMIIHYSDQLSPASGYDDITVTAKSDQYIQSIKEFLKSSDDEEDKIEDIIQLFNAVNGDWLLRLNSSPFSRKDGYFSKEKISILSAIRMLMVYFEESENTIWIPMSLEEMLRVSGNVGLSRKEGLLSAERLGFSKGATCDDILMVGFREGEDNLEICFHPIEVKIGDNLSNVIDKATQQIANTSRSLREALFPEDREMFNELTVMMTRNFLMQQILLAAEKMEVFKVCPQVNWKKITDEFRESMLNNRIRYNEDLNKNFGNGTVVSFKFGQILLESKFMDIEATDQKEEPFKVKVNLMTFPKDRGIRYLTDSYQKISDDLLEYHLMQPAIPGTTTSEFTLKKQCHPSSTKIEIPAHHQGLSFGQSVSSTPDHQKSTEQLQAESIVDQDPAPRKETSTDAPRGKETITDENVENVQKLGMEVEFGINQANGKKVIWYPNDSEQVFNFNTGVIGTSGTGKTQFVKSLITQLILEKKRNFDNPDFGILIFDYKGDYNESKKDFVEAVHPNIYKLEDLPFNPFTLVQTGSYKPRLPMHIADGFIETIARVYHLGAIQRNNLQTAILAAYDEKGISLSNKETWTRTPPTIYDVYRKYMEDESLKKNDSLQAALSYIVNYHIFEENPSKTVSLYELIKGVTVIDLQGYAPELQNLIVALALDLFYLQMQSHGSSKISGKLREITKLILVDEADNFMSQEFPALKKILKEGREFGVGLILSTQFLSHFNHGDDNYAQYIFTWVVHAMAGVKPAEVDLVFKLPAKSQEEQKILEDIPKLQKFNSIVQIGTENPIYNRDFPFYELMLKLSEDKHEMVKDPND